MAASPLTLAGLEAQLPSSWDEMLHKTSKKRTRISQVVAPVMVGLMSFYFAGGILSPITPHLSKWVPINMSAVLSLKNLKTITKLFIGIFCTCKFIAYALENHLRAKRSKCTEYFNQLLNQYLNSSEKDAADLADQALHLRVKHALSAWDSKHHPFAREIIKKHLKDQEPAKALAVYFTFFLAYDSHSLRPQDKEETKQLVNQILACCKALDYSGAGSIEIALDAITMLRDPENRSEHLKLLESLPPWYYHKDPAQADLIKELHTNTLNFLIMREQQLASCMYIEQRNPEARKQQIHRARDFIQLTPAHLKQTQEHLVLVEQAPSNYKWEDQSSYAYKLEQYCEILSRLNAQGQEAFMGLANGTTSITMRAWHFRRCISNQNYFNLNSHVGCIREGDRAQQ